VHVVCVCSAVFVLPCPIVSHGGPRRASMAMSRRACYQVISQRRHSESLLPKSLLQECLRPVLFSYRDFSTEGFKGLSRLLSLVSSCVSVTLGEKLLGYIATWPEPLRSRQPKSPTNTGASPDDVHSAAALLNLFHRLPINKPLEFMEQLVNGVVRLENALPSYRCGERERVVLRSEVRRDMPCYHTRLC
jgi:hypothetical protein